MPNESTVNFCKSELFEGVSSLYLPSCSEHVITVHADSDTSIYETALATMRRLDASPITRFVFGSLDPSDEMISVPAIQVRGDSSRHRDRLSSLQIVASTGRELEAIRLNGSEVGYVYEDDYARYCRIGALYPDCIQMPKAEQTRAVFRQMDRILHDCGMQASDLVRTWFYLDRLLEWYEQFNDVRTAFFEETGIFDKLVPVSTGIGAANPHGAALAAGALAIQPKGRGLEIARVASPLQCEAEDYRSSFSRAVELLYPNHRLLLISGTASIDPQGRSAHVGDTSAQIELTMRVVGRILESRGMDWGNAARAIAYFKDIDDHPLFESYCRREGISEFPTAIAEADVCRDDLLFEIEVDAVATP